MERASGLLVRRKAAEDNKQPNIKTQSHRSKERTNTADRAVSNVDRRFPEEAFSGEVSLDSKAHNRIKAEIGGRKKAFGYGKVKCCRCLGKTDVICKNGFGTYGTHFVRGKKAPFGGRSKYS